MASVLEGRPPAQRAEERFFLVMACIISAIIVVGFAVHLALGRSTFAVPAVYHLHAFVFFGWVALYLAQNWLIAANNVRLHRTLGLLAYGWAPVMVVMGFAIMIASLQRSGGPFFFDQNEFLFSNTLLLVLFGAMVFTALRRRRHTGWHRRLMLVAMSILTGPGLGRLLPMPLLMPNAWRIMMVVTLIFPVVGMIVDKRRQGHVHPAYFWGVGAIIAVQVIADLIAYSAWGVSVTQSIVGGTPGGERPMAAFLPPGI
ncbi:MAG: hypothetical protein H6917_03600 [Novosphingobium sp.]|nr:hypothetical protein [Novosphingobium sp.]MCP5401457.1 hypothetical protein [Novosphingobium sp.]